MFLMLLSLWFGLLFQGANDDVLPLPDVPSGLIGPKERADYIIAHFWDKMDFKDTCRSHNREFMEQNLVNYISLFPHASEDGLPANIGCLLRQASDDSVAFSIVGELMELYLNNADSPMRNEAFYMSFLEAKLEFPGIKVSDFDYIDGHGRRHSLYQTNGRLLILIYDPECKNCEEAIEKLRRNEMLCQLVTDRCLTVLAVCTGVNRDGWEVSKEKMPEEWIVAFDDGNIAESKWPDITSLPSVYLLDENKGVVLKTGKDDIHILVKVLQMLYHPARVANGNYIVRYVFGDY